MDVRNCSKCGRIFNYIGGMVVCEACKDKMEDEFQKVKDYIWENPKAPMQKIAEDCEVTTNQLRQWIREERLQLTSDSPITLECENCGTAILTGRYCQNCKNKMARGLDDAFGRNVKPEPEPKKKAEKEDKMRFLR